MSSDLKKLVQDLEVMVSERGGSIDAPARDALNAQIERLKRAIDKADAQEKAKLVSEALNIIANLLVISTNVMALLG